MWTTLNIVPTCLIKKNKFNAGVEENRHYWIVKYFSLIGKVNEKVSVESQFFAKLLMCISCRDASLSASGRPFSTTSAPYLN